MLVHGCHVVEHRELLDRLLGLEGASQSPARPFEVGQRQEVLAHRIDTTAARGDEAGQHVEERRLAGAVGADEATRPFRELNGHLIQRDDTAEVDRQLLDVDHASTPFFSAARVFWMRLKSRPKPNSDNANRVQNW